MEISSLKSIIILLFLISIPIILFIYWKINDYIKSEKNKNNLQKRLFTDFLKYDLKFKEFIGEDYKKYIENGIIENPQKDGIR
jgi:hypothetical protein